MRHLKVWHGFVVYCIGIFFLINSIPLMGALWGLGLGVSIALVHRRQDGAHRRVGSRGHIGIRSVRYDD